MAPALAINSLSALLLIVVLSRALPLAQPLKGCTTKDPTTMSPTTASQKYILADALQTLPSGEEHVRIRYCSKLIAMSHA
jgi:hypothetical protein